MHTKVQSGLEKTDLHWWGWVNRDQVRSATDFPRQLWELLQCLEGRQMVFWRLPLQGHIVFFLAWYFHPEHHFSQSLVDLLVPQGVDDRVQHWGHHRVHKGSLLVGVQPVHLLRFHIYKHTAAVHQREDNEVRGAGGESFLSLLGWWEMQDCDDYVAVWNDGYNEGCWKDKQSKAKGQHFNRPDIRTREINQGPQITEVRNDMGATEG